MRWCKDKEKEIKLKYPYSIKLYSEIMKGVDTSNYYISTYELNNKTHKWSKRIFYHLIDASILNAFICFIQFKK